MANPVPRAGNARAGTANARASNARALSVYAAHGFRRVGDRKNYYPLATGKREDAIVMSLPL